MYNNSDKNKQTVISSAILAKATVRRENGRIYLIVVFQHSTRHEFYWVFQAKSARSPRRSWRYVWHYGRDFNMGEKPYRDFGSFVDHYARINHAQVLAVRVHHTRRLATVLTKTDHESIHADWTPQDLSKSKASLVSYASFDNSRRSISPTNHKGFYFNQRNRNLDEFSQSPDEVLVYEDWCDECMSKHSYAHFADATKNKCKLGFSAMKSNPGFEYRGFNNSTGFRFTYRSVIGAGA